MSLIRIDRNPPERQLRRFGAAWLVAFSLLGYLLWQRTGSAALAGAAWTMALAVPAAGLLYLPILRWAWIGLAYLTFPLGFVVSHAILTLVFFVVLTPMGLFMRLLGRDPMHRRFRPDLPTYWLPRDAEVPAERYTRQF